jgi:hypothetical protein
VTPSFDKIPIGKPISNSTAYILDSRHQLVPIGITGEICVGGNGLARGYLNQPELTAQKFINNPFRTGERMYRTGDLGRWLPNGDIEFIGRADNQVKVRGNRIELGEIESVLQTHSDIDSAVVIARDTKQSEKELVAYMVANRKLDLKEIRACLARSLPAFMLPDHYVQLGELPLSPNGKIDRDKLPDPEGRALEADTGYIAPRNETEEKLALIWQEVLNRKRIGMQDNFFESGGNSLKALQVVARINTVFLVHINIKNIFRDPTIENIATQVHFIINQDKQKKNKTDLVQIEI